MCAERVDSVKRFGSCAKDCYGGCVYEAIWDDNTSDHPLTKAIPSKNHPLTQGIFCPKLNRRQDFLYHADRLKSAYRRTGQKGKGQFQPCTTHDLILHLAKDVQRVLDAYGPHAIAGAYYSGNSHLLSMHAPLRFFRALNARVTVGGICNEGGNAGLEELFGTYSMMANTLSDRAR